MLLHIFGVFLHPFEISLNTFQYPAVIDNLNEIIEGHINGFNLSHISPINSYNHTFLIANPDKCLLSTPSQAEIVNLNEKYQQVTLTYVIKSALTNYEARNVIRRTWASESRFSDVNIKRVFIVGSCEKSFDIDEAIQCDKSIRKEHHLYKDIVQADFTDTYYNNTIKTMTGIGWIVTYCPQSEFIAFVDDDFYVSPKNLLKFIRNPYDDIGFAVGSKMLPRFKLNDDRFYSGYLFPNSSPMRHHLSKWYVSLQEYPYDKYPPYVSAGAYVLNNRAIHEIYYGSWYTKHFRFDDIYLGIVSKKINLLPFHNPNFYFWKKSYSPKGYHDVIASHGFSDADELLRVYEEQKTLGHA